MQQKHYIAGIAFVANLLDGTHPSVVSCAESAIQVPFCSSNTSVKRSRAKHLAVVDEGVHAVNHRRVSGDVDKLLGRVHRERHLLDAGDLLRPIEQLGRRS